MVAVVVVGYEVVEFERDGVGEGQELKIQHVRDLRRPEVCLSLAFQPRLLCLRIKTTASIVHG